MCQCSQESAVEARKKHYYFFLLLEFTSQVTDDPSLTFSDWTPTSHSCLLADELFVGQILHWQAHRFNRVRELYSLWQNQERNVVRLQCNNNNPCNYSYVLTQRIILEKDQEIQRYWPAGRHWTSSAALSSKYSAFRSASPCWSTGHGQQFALWVVACCSASRCFQEEEWIVRVMHRL